MGTCSFLLEFSCPLEVWSQQTKWTDLKDAISLNRKLNNCPTTYYFTGQMYWPFVPDEELLVWFLANSCLLAFMVLLVYRKNTLYCTIMISFWLGVGVRLVMIIVNLFRVCCNTKFELTLTMEMPNDRWASPRYWFLWVLFIWLCFSNIGCVA